MFLSQPAVACNTELFPITHYFITIPGLAGNLTVPAVESPTAISIITHYFITIPGLAGNLTVPAVESPTAISVTLNSTFFPRLRKENYYIINVQSCTAYVCGETPASVTVGKEYHENS